MVYTLNILILKIVRENDGHGVHLSPDTSGIHLQAQLHTEHQLRADSSTVQRKEYRTGPKLSRTKELEGRNVSRTGPALSPGGGTEARV